MSRFLIPILRSETAAQPDITFFGEKLTDNFEKCLEADREQADLLLIIGTSLKVAPVSDIISKSYDAPAS